MRTSLFPFPKCAYSFSWLAAQLSFNITLLTEYLIAHSSEIQRVVIPATGIFDKNRELARKQQCCLPFSEHMVKYTESICGKSERKYVQRGKVKPRKMYNFFFSDFFTRDHLSSNSSLSLYFLKDWQTILCIYSYFLNFLCTIVCMQFAVLLV